MHEARAFFLSFLSKSGFGCENMPDRAFFKSDINWTLKEVVDQAITIGHDTGSGLLGPGLWLGFCFAYLVC